MGACTLDYFKKKVLVLGLARSGMAAIKLLMKLGAEITLSESKPKEQIEELKWLCENGVEVIGQGDELFSRRFDIVVKNPGIPYKALFIKRLEEIGTPIITETELAFQTAKRQRYIAITGTNGKTTTATITYNIFKNAFPGAAYLAGNIGVPLCEVVLRENLMEKEGRFIILEMSNFQLLHIKTFKPEIATIINMAPDHLDYMESLDDYYKSKTLIYKNMDEDSVFIKNVDDPIIKEYMNLFPAKSKIKTVSLVSDCADFTVDENAICAYGTPVISRGDIKIAGMHNVQNIMISAAMASTAGIDFSCARKAIASFKGVEHRIEFVRKLNGVMYYNDSKSTNTHATATAVKAFKEPVILLVGGHEKGLPAHGLQKELTNVKKVIGFGECAKRLSKELAGDGGIVVRTIDEALLKAAEAAEAGDVVLLSPAASSFDQFVSYEERGDYFKRLVHLL
ncbi:MAG: UDP-N-acetylmuramoyl-L-alanine--D-glutamate ligase [Clostridiales bacterium]|jgi:UDP-N-acetylmuramoylalanine--D-glutamate ligase|nr:UDP-N-acetylmuramoyl-L-alanine--D-glutamate ligase [Clostridiales bacterium]